MREPVAEDGLAALTGPVRGWFAQRFPGGPTPAQRLAWPAIAAGEHLLLVAPTGTGKTLAAFLAILDRLYRAHLSSTLGPGLRCVYVSPLRSLGYDIERNLAEPLEAIRQNLGLAASPVTVGVRTGDTSAYHRRKLRDDPPHLLITTPESLALLLSQAAWREVWQTIEYIIIDEIHALAPTKRGADLAISIERLSALAGREPSRLGLSATCRPAAPVAAFLVGPTRRCRIIEAPAPPGSVESEIQVESLLQSDEPPHRGLTYRRLLRRLRAVIERNRTVVVFANTRAFTEKLTHDLRLIFRHRPEAIAAHHSALDAARRRAVEAAMKAGALRAVVTSTSLELGVDIGSADVTVMVGLPGSVARCLQRVGRSGHRVGAASRGILLAATAAELAGAAVTAQAARAGQSEPLRAIRAPLDVLCQQLIGMACGGAWSVDEAFALIRRAEPMAALDRDDFEACLAFLAGELAAPAGAYEPEPGAGPRWTSPRIWRRGGRFGVRSRRVLRWFWSNVGTIQSEESVRVLVEGQVVGTVEGAYADRLQPGDRFVLDGRVLEFRRRDGWTLLARPARGEPDLPRWSSDRQGLSAALARALAAFREAAGHVLLTAGSAALRRWLADVYALDDEAAALLETLFSAQERLSEIPSPDTLLVEESPRAAGFAYAFHAPLARSACEALGRATAARLGRRFRRNLFLIVADLGWSIQLPEGAQLDRAELPALLDPAQFADDVLEGLDCGALLARRFRYVAATALMVLRNPAVGRPRVGGLHWVSQRLYPLVKAACPDHPLLRETRREVLDDLLDTTSALAWLAERPTLRFRALEASSPFAAAWIDPSGAGAEALLFESPDEALRRLHARLVGPEALRGSRSC
jgi:ATP-dependent Lhr-like helicase